MSSGCSNRGVEEERSGGDDDDDEDDDGTPLRQSLFPRRKQTETDGGRHGNRGGVPDASVLSKRAKKKRLGLCVYDCDSRDGAVVSYNN